MVILKYRKSIDTIYFKNKNLNVDDNFVKVRNIGRYFIVENA